MVEEWRQAAYQSSDNDSPAENRSAASAQHPADPQYLLTHR